MIAVLAPYTAFLFFEPAFYSTDLPDWGTSLLMAQKLGPQAEVLVDTGHHPQGTNIAQIVAQLLDEDRLGRHGLSSNQCGSAFSDALWIRRFTKEIEYGRRKIDVADGLGDVK